MKKKGAKSKEVRAAERYAVEAPVKITMDFGDREKTIEGKTLNISSAGAYVVTPRLCVKPGLRVHLEVLLSLGVLREAFGLSDRLCVKVGGYVVRNAQGGLAVRFDRTYALGPANTSRLEKAAEGLHGSKGDNRGARFGGTLGR